MGRSSTWHDLCLVESASGVESNACIFHSLSLALSLVQYNLFNHLHAKQPSHHPASSSKCQLTQLRPCNLSHLKMITSTLPFAIIISQLSVLPLPLPLPLCKLTLQLCNPRLQTPDVVRCSARNGGVSISGPPAALMAEYGRDKGGEVVAGSAFGGAGDQGLVADGAGAGCGGLGGCGGW